MRKYGWYITFNEFIHWLWPDNFSKGEKGASCIQRAICETTRIFADQKDNPSGFGVEILRAIFR